MDQSQRAWHKGAGIERAAETERKTTAYAERLKDV